MLNISKDDTVFSVSKLFFAYGLGNSLYSPLRNLATTVLFPGTPPEEKLFEIIEDYGVTVFSGVPRIYARMLTVEGAKEKYNLSSLRLCVSGGEALPPAIYNQWREKFGIEIIIIRKNSRPLYLVPKANPQNTAESNKFFFLNPVAFQCSSAKMLAKEKNIKPKST